METKKSKKSDLEKVKSIFFQFGLIISLAIVITAFEWTTNYNNSEDLGVLISQSDNCELPPITFPKEDVKPPTPKATLEIINIVKDDEIIVDTIQFNSTELVEYNPIDTLLTAFEPEVEEFIPFIYAEKKPEFKGGEKEMFKFIYNECKMPKIAIENGIQGTVYIEFSISKTGKVINCKILRSIDPLLDKEALRVVRLMPDWNPGIQAGKTVSVSNYVLPFKFTLAN